MKFAVVAAVVLSPLLLANISAPAPTKTSRYLTMRDGVRIAVDLYLPPDLKPDERIPAMLEQTRYYRGYAVRFWAKPFFTDPRMPGIEKYVAHRYAYILVDARGSGASFGTRAEELTPDEVKDGGEIISWIASQSWSNGSVATRGGSYQGATAALAVTTRNPALKAAIPTSSLNDAYRDIAFPGGVRLASVMNTWAMMTGAMDQNTMRGTVVTGIGALAFLGVPRVDEDTDGSLLAAAQAEHKNNYNLAEAIRGFRFIDHDSQVVHMSLYPRLAAAAPTPAPMFNYSGWYDGAFTRGTIGRFLNSTNPGDRLLLGPWNHDGDNINPFSTTKGDYSRFADELGFLEPLMRPGIPATSAPRVKYFTVGENKWKMADGWPPASTNVEWYATENHSLARANGSEGSDEYKVDYSARSGVQSRWRSITGLDFQSMPIPDRRDADRKLLTYTSAPLGEDMEITGHPSIDLFVSSSATDGNFIVYLEDVDPEGHVWYITEGWFRAIHRKPSTAPPPYKYIGPYHTFAQRDSMPLVPGETAQLSFEILPISYLVRRGHSLRVAISGADADHVDPVTPAAPTIRVHRGGTAATRVVLPIVSPRP